MTDDSKPGLQTRSVHAGEPRPRIGDAVSMPIFQSSTFVLEGGESYHDLRYIRLNNTPNHRAVEAKLAALEETEAALVTSSGMSAITNTLLAYLKPGDHLLAQNCLYGGSQEFIAEILKEHQIEATFVSLEEPGEWQAGLRDRTRLFYVESTTNPLLEVGRLDQVPEFARGHDLVSIIDNTFPSPVNFRPVHMGYDLTIHSATKYLNGHSDLCAGVVAGRRSEIDRIRELLNLTGGSLDPHPCALLHRGLKTLPLRVRAQNDSALALATALAEHSAVEHVRYPGLPDDPAHERAFAWFEGFGAMVTFTPAGGVEAADEILERLEIPLVAPSLGGVETLVTRPATTSHAGLSPDDRRAMGITDEMIRVSVGVEDAADLIADFRQALG